MSVATIIADAVRETCEVESSLPYRPATLTHKIAFVAPSDVWKQVEEAGFCEVSIGLDVYLVSGVADYVDSFDWLDAQTSLLMEANPIDVGSDSIVASQVSAPFVFSDGSGASYLTARVAYSRFRN